ncbi:MAG: helix-turn-helix domain-containing protein [Pseudomonadota bacterium]
MSLEANALDAHAYTIDDARRHLGNLSRYSIYQYINSGKLQSVKLGHRRLIRREDLLNFIDAHLVGVEA